MNNHIFITHTAFQEFIAEASAINIKKNNPSDIITLATENTVKIRDNSIWDRKIQLKSLTPSSFGKNKESIYRENLITLNELTNKHAQTTLYISDIQWPFNNRLYFDKNNKQLFNFKMIIDGTLAYYNPQKSIYSFLKDTFKYAAGEFGFALRYTPYFGSVMGWERSRISEVYGLNLLLSPIHPAKHVNIEKEISKSGNLDIKKTIFLDQPFHNHMSTSDIRSFTEDTLNFLKKEGLEDTHYKSHHFSNKDNINTFNFKKENLLDTSECIERIIPTYGFGTIVSYNSTALFTLKTIYKDNIRCIALHDKKSRINVSKENLKRIHELFYKSGVELHEIG